MVLCLAAGLIGCSDESDTAENADSGAADLPAGATAIVVIANPVVNEAHETGVPAELTADHRSGIAVDADPGGADVTDATGLAVVEAVAGATELRLGPDPAALALTVQAQGDVYDAPIAYDGTGAAFFDATPIRYPVGENSAAIYLDPGTPIREIEQALSTDDAIVVLRPGTYPGDLVITGRGALLFGEGFSQSTVIIDGSVDARGEQVRLRGLTIEGGVTAAGNNFGMSFCVIRGRADITGNGGAFLRNAFCDDANVPSSSATLLDNSGLAPLAAIRPEACDPETEPDD
jgi:hypothetical protein